MAQKQTSTQKEKEKKRRRRLQLIKKRHHELILKPRYSIAEDWDSEDGIDPYIEQEHFRAVRDVCDLDGV